MFDKVLIANRGEIAVRIIRSCRELGIGTVCAYSSADQDSLAVRMADEAVRIGPGPSARSYRNGSALLYACARTGATAIHPGYGFLSEDPAFAELCEQVGVTFIGPRSEQIRLMGDKIAARRAMRAAGVPVLPGSFEAVTDDHQARCVAADIGYPVMVKATAGGGGRGIAMAKNPEELTEAFTATRAAAQSLYADNRVYIERFVRGARHIEVQVLGDDHGNLVHLGERDCSVQRQRQKLIEESPAPGISSELRERLCAAAVAGAGSVGYRSAGTVEFLVDDEGEPYFIEMNTRLQVEHPVTEARSGLDLVAWMIRVAAGERLDVAQDDIDLDGHAIEIRVNAEDAARDWAGSSGRIDRVRLPDGPGIRVDTHIFDGYHVPPFYDSLLAKIIVSAPDRRQALELLSTALDDTACEGITTNLDLHRALIRHPDFRAGRHRLDLVERLLTESTLTTMGAGKP
ncbi:MAG: acetyl-CoA carboxylase biotin carboxylase subunit [Stackebrandtia sp.]